MESASTEKTQDGEQTPQPVAKTPLYRRRIFLLVYLCGLLAILAVILPVLFLAIFPNIIRNKLSNSVMNLTVVNITLPISETSFQLHNEGELSTSGSNDATLRFPDSVSISWNGSVIGNMGLDDLHVEEGKAKLDQTSTFNITDPTRWADFATVLVNAEEFTWTMQGKTTVRAMGITKSGFDFVKNVTLKGGNGFNNVTITNYALGPVIMPGRASALGQIISANLNSPSDISLVLGSLGLSISYGSLDLGLVQTNNLTIYPGDNNFVLQGPLAFNLTSIPPNLLVDIATKYVKGQNLTVTIQGAFAKPNGVDEVSWLSAAVKRLSFNRNLTMTRNSILDGLFAGIPVQ